jgi:hypothetical protein
MARVLMNERNPQLRVSLELAGMREELEFLEAYL